MRLLAHAGLANWPFDSLDPQSYDFIMADPPWEFSNYSQKGEKKSAKRHYRCLPIDQIKAFPVQDLACENCVLWLWATGAMLRNQIDVLDAWGFEYKTEGVWNKVTPSGKPCFGTGYILRSSHEPFLIGTRGKPRTAKNVRSSFNGVRRLHSQKPEEAFREAERLMPKARRVELFSRTNRPGWESWGDQVGSIAMEAA